MGTNYYLHPQPRGVQLLKPADTRLHIGKDSWGWLFLFASPPDLEMPIRSWRQWRNLLQAPGARIENEYGDQLTFIEFEAVLVRSCSKRESVSHLATASPWGNPPVSARNRQNPYYRVEEFWRDEEGYEFTAWAEWQ